MSRGFSAIIPATIIFVVLVAVLPVSAYTVAMYGSNAGFNPDLHQDTVTVARQIPGSSGADLDSAVSQFTKPSVDVIILGGDDTFSPSTAAKIEAAVAEGKILVVAYPSNHLFDAVLPASNGGSGPAGTVLNVAGSDSVISKEVFKDMPARYHLLTAGAPDKEQAIAREGATVLMDDDSGMPILLFWKYGKGMVIEWTTTPIPSYMTETQTDTLLYRLIMREKPVQHETTPTTEITTVPTSNQTVTITSTIVPPTVTATTVIPTTVTGTPSTTGGVSVYSTPLNASILIDGKYYGLTPANLTGVPQGSHIIRLALSGYYDYEGTIYVIPGETNHAFGTLQPLNLASSAPTAAVPIIIPVVTAEPTQTEDKGLLGNSSVLVALIGVITASIAAGATVFTHYAKVKEEKKE